MLNGDQKAEINQLVYNCLIQAEERWAQSGHILTKGLERFDESFDSSLPRAEVVPSKIPGHEFVDSHDHKTEQLIAIVADMRDSSKHLTESISNRSGITLNQRVFYETSALLPALERTINFEKGGVTEYLGDGLLGFFRVSSDKKKSISSACKAAQDCVGDSLEIVNNQLKIRYDLPPISIGVGMDMGFCMITTLGIPGSLHPKAFGRCVYNATKLSDEYNEVKITDYLRDSWPSTKGGTIGFRKRTGRNGVPGNILVNQPSST